MRSLLAPSILSTAVVLGGGGMAYAALYPDSRIFGPVIVAGSDPGEIALTFDDGPNDAATPQLLDLLARHGVRATFFLLGGFVRQRPALARVVAEAGHLLGNHTLTHPWLAWQSRARIRRELGETSAAIEDATGQAVRFFRPPHGARRPAVLAIARELGMATVQWNVTGADWKLPTAESIAAVVGRGVARNRRLGRGSNVLLHDGGHRGMGADRLRTVRATELLLGQFAGARFVTIDAWEGNETEL